MAHNNQNLVLYRSERSQFFEVQNELNKEGSKRSISQVVACAIRVAMANTKVARNADFRNDSKLFGDPLKRTILNIQKGLITGDRGLLR